MNKNDLVLIGLVILIAILVIGIGWLLWRPGVPSSPLPSTDQNQSVLFLISSNTCSNCSDASILVSQIQSTGAVFSAQNLVFETDSLAQQLVAQYNIQKLPVIVIVPTPADFERLNAAWQAVGTIESDQALVLREVPPPFFDVATRTVKGLVDVWKISKSDCADCTQAPGALVFGQIGIGIRNETDWMDTDPQAQAFISQYGISKLPAVILSEDIREYASFLQALEQGGSFETDGRWVQRFPAPYYWDLNLNRKVGAIHLTRLNFADCNGCFALSELETFLTQNFGLKIASVEDVDWKTARGQQFVSEYGISKIPTLLIGGEVEAYRVLTDNVQAVGFWSLDQNIVFDAHDRLGEGYSYFDLDQNQLITLSSS